MAPVVSRTLPCVAAKYCAAWAALPSTTLPAGKVLAARSQAVVLYPGCVGGGADVFGGFHRIRVSGIHTKGCALQKLRHGAGQQAAGMYGNAGGLALFLGPQVGCYADGNGNAQRGQRRGRNPALR